MKLTTRFARWYSLATVRPRLALIERRSDANVKLVTRSVRRALSNGTGVSAFEDIERARQTLLADSNPISISDFGAGKGGAQEDSDLASRGVEVTKTVGEAAQPSKSQFWCRFLYWLTWEVQSKATLEFGTCVGISASYQAAAMKDRSLEGSTVISMEGSPSLAARALETVSELGFESVVAIECGRFVDLLPKVIEHHQPFDIVFIDGHHDEVATVEYFEALRGATAPDAVIIFDDIRWTPGMTRAWEQVKNDNRVNASIDLGSVGICLLGDRIGQPTAFSAPLRGM